MPALTRRRDPEASQESWLILLGDVYVGTISRSIGRRAASGVKRPSALSH
jgi:hypothetical protein